MAGQQTFPIEIGGWGFTLNSTSTFLTNLTFTSREERIYIKKKIKKLKKKKKKKNQNKTVTAWVDMAFVQSKHYPINSGSILRCYWGALG